MKAPGHCPSDFGSASWQWNMGISFLTCNVETPDGPGPLFYSFCAVSTRKRKLTHMLMVTALPSFPLLLHSVSVCPHLYPMRCSKQLIALLIPQLRLELTVWALQAILDSSGAILQTLQCTNRVLRILHSQFLQHSVGLQNFETL